MDAALPTGLRAALDAYLTARAGLTAAGLRLGRGGVTAALGEWHACRWLGLALNANPVQRGYDATDAGGRKYEVKARFDDPGTSFDFRGATIEFDFLVVVLLSPRFDLVHMARVTAARAAQRRIDARGIRRLRYAGLRADPGLVWWPARPTD